MDRPLINPGAPRTAKPPTQPTMESWVSFTNKLGSCRAGCLHQKPACVRLAVTHRGPVARSSVCLKAATHQGSHGTHHVISVGDTVIKFYLQRLPLFLHPLLFNDLPGWRRRRPWRGCRLRAPWHIPVSPGPASPGSCPPAPCSISTSRTLTTLTLFLSSKLTNPPSSYFRSQLPASV